MKPVPRLYRAGFLALALLFELCPVETYAQTAPVIGSRPLAATSARNPQLRRGRSRAAVRLNRAQRSARRARRQIQRNTMLMRR
jgi:hypothetical protein